MFTLMANCFAWVKGRNKPVRSVKLVIVGLDDAGKTTTVACLQGEPPDGITPTMGFANATFTIKKWNITLYDLGGGSSVRSVWEKYYADIYGIIFTVDSVNVDRLEESKDALSEIFASPKVKGKPVVVFANKQDKKDALNEKRITKHLDLQSLAEKYEFSFNVFPCSALKGYGKQIDQSINMGLEWLLNAIDQKYSVLHEKVEHESAIQKEIEAKERKERMERIRKLREEREKAAQEAGVEDEEESDNDVVAGNPFRNINEQIDVTEKREKKAKEKIKKIKAHQQETQQNENNGDEDSEENDGNVKKKKKKKTKMRTPDNSMEVNELESTPRNETKMKNRPDMEVNFNDENDELYEKYTPRKKKKKKKRVYEKEEEENLDELVENVDLTETGKKRVEKHGENNTRTNFINVTSLDDVRNIEDDQAEGELEAGNVQKKKRRKKKKKQNEEAYEDISNELNISTVGELPTSQCKKKRKETSSNDDNDRVKRSQEEIRAELFRAKSFDALDGPGSSSDVQPSNAKITKKKKKKKVLQSEENENEDIEKTVKKKEKVKNKTVPTSCNTPADNEINAGAMSRELPALNASNGHVSKLEPIKLRGRLPDLGTMESSIIPSWARAKSSSDVPDLTW